MKYAVDRIEDDIVVLEEVETGNIKEVLKCNLPGPIQDGSILSFIDGKYFIDLGEEGERRNRIREKMERLKGLNNK